ncbi:MAG: hypothetical protein QOI57_2109, partial [Rubrobacteraceae bacterium]|nr:hypothetical protein [Rubrobacteraceae bacterium]
MDEMLRGLETEVYERIFLSEVKASQNGQYRHWDEVRHRTPPEGL